MAIDDHIHNTAKPIKPHPDDVAVDNFAVAMKEKLAIARAKGRSGWEECDPDDLSAMLYEHVQKGDPRDVANFCMFLWNLGQPITQCHKAPAVAQELVAWAETDEHGEIAWGEEGCFSNDPAWIENPIPLYSAPPSAAINEQLLEALKRIELAVDWYLGRSPFTQSNKGKGYQFAEAVREQLLQAHDKARAAIRAAEAEAAKGGV